MLSSPLVSGSNGNGRWQFGYGVCGLTMLRGILNAEVCISYGFVLVAAKCGYPWGIPYRFVLSGGVCTVIGWVCWDGWGICWCFVIGLQVGDCGLGV